jgi:subtilisin family serine protease
MALTKGNELAIRQVRLTRLMERTEGRADVLVALIDGPIASGIAAISVEVPGLRKALCTIPSSRSCEHGTFVAAMLAAPRGSNAPAICPGCTLLVRSIFVEEVSSSGNRMPSTNPEELADAITASINAGARVINLSVAVLTPSGRGEREIQFALDEAVHRNVVIVAAAGNQGVVGSSIITRHPWVIPVVGLSRSNSPQATSNLGASIGRRGLAAPGAGITSLRPDGSPNLLEGTSVAAPFVTGAIALLWSERPKSTATEIKRAVMQAHSSHRKSIVPPLLDAEMAYQSLAG